MNDRLIPTEDQERQVQAFLGATDGLPRVVAQRKRYSGVAVQFHPPHAAQLVAGGLQIDLHDDVTPPTWTLSGVPLEPGDYIVNVSGQGIRVYSRAEFDQEWEVVGDA